MQSLGWNLGKIETNQAKVELYDGDFKQSAIYYTAARDRLKKLADEDPENLRLKESLADALYGLAVASQELGDQVGAKEAFAATVEIRRVACQVEPDNLARQIRMLLALARSNLLKEAIPIAEAMRKKLGTMAAIISMLHVSMRSCRTQRNAVASCRKGILRTACWLRVATLSNRHES